MVFLPYFLATLLFTCIHTARGDGILNIYKKQCTGDTDVFNINHSSLSCYGDCTWGKNGTLTTTYTFGRNLSSSEADLSLEFLKLSVFNATIDLCSGNSWKDGHYYCPSEGTYTTYTTITIPGSESSFYSKYLVWMTMKLNAVFELDDGYSVSCQFLVDGRYSKYSYVFSTSFVVLFGIAGFKWRTRKRFDVRQLNDDEDEVSIDFVEMKGHHSKV